jgi:hypothetical protein
MPARHPANALRASRLAAQALASPLVDIEHRCGKRFRRFLRQIVPDAAHDAVFMSPRETLEIIFAFRQWRHAIGIAFERDHG